MKRLLALMLLLLLAVPAPAESYLVSYRLVDSWDDTPYLIGDDGRVIAGPDQYANIRECVDDALPPEQRMYGVTRAVRDYREDMPWQEIYASAMMNGEGRLLTDFLYDDFYYEESSGLYASYRIADDTRVWLDGEGREYDEAARDARAEALAKPVICRGSATKLYGVALPSGHWLVAAAYQAIRRAERANLYLCVTEDSFGCSMVDAANGRTLREYDFSDRKDLQSVSFWEEDCGLLRIHLYFGEGQSEDIYLDQSGDPLPFDLPADVTLSSPDYGRSGENARRLYIEDNRLDDPVMRLIDLQGRVCSPAFVNLHNGLWQDGHGRFIYERVATLEGGSTRRAEDWDDPMRRYGVIDENGKILLEARYSLLQLLSMDRFWVREGARVGMIDGKGNWLFSLSDYQFLTD